MRIFANIGILLPVSVVKSVVNRESVQQPFLTPLRIITLSLSNFHLSLIQYVQSYLYFVNLQKLSLLFFLLLPPLKLILKKFYLHFLLTNLILPFQFYSNRHSNRHFYVAFPLPQNQMEFGVLYQTFLYLFLSIFL